MGSIISKTLLRQFINGWNEKVVLAECISQVLTDKGSPIILQGEPKAKGILEIEQDSIQDSKQDFQDSNSFYPYHSSYPYLASNDKNAGEETLREENKENKEKKYYIDKEGYLQGLDIIKTPITRLEFSLTNGFKPKAIVLHRTDSSTAKSTLEFWNNPNNAKIGTHFLIDKDGTIYQCASLYKWTQHVGDIKVKNLDINDKNYKNKTYIQASSIEKNKKYPNRYPINSDSIGIEVVGKYDDKTKRYPNATTNQLKSLEQLVIILLELFNINKTDIYAHAKIAYKDKNSTEGVSLLEDMGKKL